MPPLTPDEIEKNKRAASLRFGGLLLAITTLLVVIPGITPWVWPPLLVTNFILISLSASSFYDQVILKTTPRKWPTRFLVGFSVLFSILSVTDAYLRQSHRLGDCWRLEREIVTALPGGRADASNAFQALRCNTSGGILEYVAGASNLKEEAKLRQELENEQRQKDGKPPLDF